jgi:hypothetical protein
VSGKGLSYVRGKWTKLGEHSPKVRLSQDRIPIEPLTQQQSWVRGERPFSPPLAILVNPLMLTLLPAKKLDS